MIEQQLIQRLVDGNTLAAGDVRPEFRAENTGASPGIVLQRTQEDQPRGLNGEKLATRGTFNVDCYGADYQTVKQLSEQVRVLLDGISGAYGSTRIWACRLVGNQDLTEVDGDKTIRHTSLTFNITYVES